MSRRKRKGDRRPPAGGGPLGAVVPALGRYAGWIAAGGAVLVVAVVAALILTSGSTDENGSLQASPTTDPRVGTATPAVAISIAAEDDGQQVNPRFQPNSVSGPVGEVLELAITNSGTVAHNLRVSGADLNYDTPDDFASAILNPGNETRLRIKIGTAGSYPFRCDLHPAQQTGVLVLR